MFSERNESVRSEAHHDSQYFPTGCHAERYKIGFSTKMEGKKLVALMDKVVLLDCLMDNNISGGNMS
jgi:hypothetical protein